MQIKNKYMSIVNFFLILMFFCVSLVKSNFIEKTVNKCFITLLFYSSLKSKNNKIYQLHGL